MASETAASRMTIDTAPIFLTAEELAPLIGLPCAGSFLRRRAMMERDQHFPLPLPHCRRPLLWRRDQVQAWLARQGLPATRPAPEADTDATHLLRLARSA